MNIPASQLFFFFFNDTATTEIYTLSLHDALPISVGSQTKTAHSTHKAGHGSHIPAGVHVRSEEHTSELQSHHDLVCRLLLEKKKNPQLHSTIIKNKQNNLNSSE